MTFQEIQELIKLLNKSNLAEFKMENGDFKISVRTNLYKDIKSTQVVASPPITLPSSSMMSVPVPAAVPPSPAPAEAPPAPVTPPSAPAKEEAPAAKAYKEIKSPMVGTFYRSSSPDKDPFAEVGQVIKPGDTVCIIEAMKLFNEIESEIGGKIVKVLVDNAQPVEYDQALFLVEPD
ncbi:MAG: hypothetical protein RLY31_1685 [Bacteroidota bacterium]